MADDIIGKYCSKCKAAKAVGEFHCNRRMPDGLAVHCKVCSAARGAAWYVANTEKVRAQGAAWRAANPEKYKARKAAWRRANPDKAKASDDAWRAANPIKAAAIRAAWHKANREKSSAVSVAWCKANPDRARAKDHRRRARELSAPGSWTKADIATLLRQQGGKCAHSWCCVDITEKRHIDHVIPLARGGTNDPRNLQLLCARCNRRKGTKHPIDFAQLHGLLL
jgi:5-methylcytosine-specific restriction endonuclease McrA